MAGRRHAVSLLRALTLTLALVPVFGCGLQQWFAPSHSTTSTAQATPGIAPPRASSPEPRPRPEDAALTTRTINDRELLEISRRDPSLTPVACKEILARLNNKARPYVSEDIQAGRPLRVPNDFGSYRDWSPLPSQIPGIVQIDKLILITKDTPFLGWYARGRLVKSSFACVGRSGEETEVGVYSILEKDADHVSRSYRNSYGEPALMPWSLRIYGTVWIHAGDISGPYCSHGCVILPMEAAEELYSWSDGQTVVLVVESVGDLDRFLDRNRKQMGLLR